MPGASLPPDERDRAGGRQGLLADRRGTTLIEFAFLAPVLLLLLLGMIEIARFNFTQSTLETATAAALRQATIDGAAGDGELLQVFRDNLTGVDPVAVRDFTVTREPAAGTPLVRITVRAAMTFEPIVTLLFANPLRLEAIARGVALN